MNHLAIIVKTFHKAYAYTIRAVPKFVCSVTEFEEVSTGYDGRCKMWALLEIPAARLDVVVHVNMQWRSGRSRVNKACHSLPDCYGQICDILLFAFNFGGFSASHVLGSGPACRTQIRSIRVGLEQRLLMVGGSAFATDSHLQDSPTTSNSTHALVQPPLPCAMQSSKGLARFTCSWSRHKDRGCNSGRGSVYD